jgi:hypothetical protein
VYYTGLTESPASGENGWNPIPKLLVPDKDVTVLFLSANDIQFLNQVDDLWYSAHIVRGEMQITHISGPDVAVPMFVRDDPVRALGCIERYQFCNPNVSTNSSCTALNGIKQAVQGAPQLYQDEAQRAHLKWSVSAIKFMAAGLTEIFGYFRTAALQSCSTLSQGMQSALLGNQWELEVKSWFKLTMADLQRSILKQATGPTEPAVRQYLVRPNITEERQVCANQKIRSDSFASFNLLGLTIIFALGSLITLLSFVLPMAVERVQRRRNPYSSLEWVANDTLQLQRLAHEAVNAGAWRGTHTDFPTIDQEELLAVLDVSCPKHPKLAVVGSKNELLESSVETE